MTRKPARILEILRDPAAQTILEIAGLLFLVGGSVLGWFNILMARLARWLPWLTQTRLIPNWQIAGLGLICLAIAFLWLRAGPLRRRRSPTPIARKVAYRKVWGVLWGWPPPSGDFVAAGPLCPDHKLPLQVKKIDTYPSKKRFDFVCPGPEGAKGHTFKGPDFSQLVPADGWGDRDPNIFEDVNARLKAEDIRA